MFRRFRSFVVKIQRKIIAVSIFVIIQIWRHTHTHTRKHTHSTHKHTHSTHKRTHSTHTHTQYTQTHTQYTVHIHTVHSTHKHTHTQYTQTQKQHTQTHTQYTVHTHTHSQRTAMSTRTSHTHTYVRLHVSVQITKCKCTADRRRTVCNAKSFWNKWKLRTADRRGCSSRPWGKCELKCVEIHGCYEIIVFHRVLSICGWVKLVSKQRKKYILWWVGYADWEGFNITTQFRSTEFSWIFVVDLYAGLTLRTAIVALAHTHTT